MLYMYTCTTVTAQCCASMSYFFTAHVKVLHNLLFVILSSIVAVWLASRHTHRLLCLTNFEFEVVRTTLYCLMVCTIEYMYVFKFYIILGG